MTYEADIESEGNTFMGVLGYGENPNEFVKFYVIENWGIWQPLTGQLVGTLVSDGGTYEIYFSERQPVDYLLPLFEYWSVRTEERSSGTITLANHFDAWAGHDLVVEELKEVAVFVEGYMSAGTARVEMSMAEGP